MLSAQHCVLRPLLMPPVDFRLLLVTDRRRTGGRSLSTVLRAAVAGGVPAVQLRERDLLTVELLALTKELRSITASRAVPLIMNDRVDLVLALNLDGVHLRADSLPVSVVRRLVGASRLVGVSTHTVQEVSRANQEGADYVVFGPVFDTVSKRPFGDPVGLAALAEACHRSTVPVFAIGGVTSARVADVRRAGAHGVAVIGAILDRDDVAAATNELVASLSL